MSFLACSVIAALLFGFVPVRAGVEIFGLFKKHQTATPAPARAAGVARISGNCNVAREQRTHDVTWMFGDLNRLRAGAHAPPLALDSRLCTVAVRFADDLIAHHSFGHVSSTGQSPFDRIRSAGIAYRTAAENVAQADNVVSGEHVLYDDPPHRDNMLNGSYRHVGIAAVKNRDGTVVFVQDFTD